MARKRLSMRKIRDVLRLKYGLGRSNREIGAILPISHSTVGSYVRRAREAGVSWPPRTTWTTRGWRRRCIRRLRRRVFGGRSRTERTCTGSWRVTKGVTLQFLWIEYREAHPDGYQYSRFCDRYREWRGRVDVVLRQVYRAGEKAFVDYAGPTVEVTDRRTGEGAGSRPPRERLRVRLARRNARDDGGPAGPGDLGVLRRCRARPARAEVDRPEGASGPDLGARHR